MMNIQQYNPYYPYMTEAQMQYVEDGEGQSKDNRLIVQECSNYNEYNIVQQSYQFPTPYPYSLEYPKEADIPAQMKNKKIRKQKNLDQKSLLPKTLESEKQGQDNFGSSTNYNQSEQIVKPLPPYPQIYHYPQGAPLPKLQSDIVLNNNGEPQGSQEGSQQTQKQKGQHQQTKKPKKEHINTGHWSTDEHQTYIKFLQQYENIMTSSMMKKTSKIFKQMSELIGTRTPSQCRSHHQKFNPYALRGENGKRLPRTERSRAGRKKKNPISEIPKAEEINIYPYQYNELDPYYVMYDQKLCFYPQMEQQQQQFLWPSQDQEIQSHTNIKKEEEQDNQNQVGNPQQEHYEDFLKGNLYHRNLQSDLPNFERSIQNDLLI